MKNNRLFNKTFILVTVLFTAFVVLASCSNAAEPKKNNLDSQGIVVTGSFTFDGMTAGGTSASRSAVPSYSEFNITDYYGVVLGYECTEVWGYDGNGNQISTMQKQDWSVASGTVDMSTKKWNILLPADGTYCIEIQIFIKDDDPDDDVPILIGDSSAQDIVVVGIDAISQNLNRTYTWPDAVTLYPNPGYTDKQTTFYYVGKTYIRKYTEVPINLRFRYPTASNITAIYSNVLNCSFIYDTIDDSYNNVELESVLAGDNGEITLVTITGVKEINEIKQKNDYGAFYDPEPYAGSNEGIIEFKDSTGKTVYSCNESITLIPGFTTDTWYWNDENDPHYYKDSNGVTYFNITQEMLDNYTPVEILSNGSNTKYPVVLFDNSSDSYGYSIFNADDNLEGAALDDGLELATGRKVLDFAIAPTDSNQAYGYINYNESNVEVFTAESDARGIKDIIRYPSYGGYQYGEIIASLDTDDDVLSMYAAHDGYIYLLLGKKDSFGSITNVSSIKRVCVNSDSDYFRVLQSFEFTDSESQPLDLKTILHGSSTAALANSYKITAMNYYGQDNYLFLTYVAEASDDYYFYFKRINIPVIGQYDGTSTVTVSVVENTTLQTFSMKLEDMTPSALPERICEKAYVSDAVIIAKEYQASGNSTYISGDMYVLLHSPDNAYNSLGGVIKLQKITDSTLTNSIVKIGEINEKSYYIRGWYTSFSGGHDPFTNENENLYLYGPSKFVARKPDELVIADEKSYKYNEDSQEKEYNGDRVVKINLADFADPAKQMDVTTVSTKFSWEIEVSCDGTKYVQY